jgi:hypothetical protein
MIWEILRQCILVTLYHRLLVNKSLQRWGNAFLSISMSVCRTTPARLSTQLASAVEMADVEAPNPGTVEVKRKAK